MTVESLLKKLESGTNISGTVIANLEDTKND